ncbi:MAG: hypothetical protein ACE5E3_03920 [Mariprofundus sp.]
MKKMFIVLFCIAGLAACKTQVVGKQQHASFTHDSVMQSRFVIGGVVSAVRPLDDMTRMRFSDLMGRAFAEEAPRMAMVRTGHVLKALGYEPFRQMLDAYRESGVIDLSDAAQLRRAFPDTRYLMLTRIEKNHVSQNHNQTETDVADSIEDEKKGEYEQVRVDVSLTTERQMGATLSIYDLRQNVVAWSGYVSKSEINSNDSSRTFNKDMRLQEELVDAFINSLIGLESGEYPDAPDEEVVLANIFEGFAENMPESPK